MRARALAQSAPAGSTGNNTHASVPVPSDADALGLEFNITVAGATPTITWKYQASDDDASLADASSDWYDLITKDADTGTNALSKTKTAVGVYESEVDLRSQPCAKIRLVTSANTNVTYQGKIRSYSEQAQ